MRNNVLWDLNGKTFEDAKNFDLAYETNEFELCKSRGQGWVPVRALFECYHNEVAAATNRISYKEHQITAAMALSALSLVVSVAVAVISFL